MIVNYGLTIVIVNWNAGAQLAAAVNSIIQHHNGFVDSVVVIDNASTDDSLAIIEDLTALPFSLNIIRNIENRGFAAASNQGAALASSEYLLFLNPDTRLFENSLSLPLAFMQEAANATVGICGVQLLDEGGRVSRSCARFPSLSCFVAHILGVDRILPSMAHVMAEWSHDQTCDVNQVIGAFFLVRRKLFVGLGGFDEQFFVYFEEVDFSHRAHQAGWRSVYLAEAQAFHAGGGTSQQVKAHRLFYSLRSRLLYGFKHFTPWQAWILVLITLSIEPVMRIFFSIVKNSLNDVRNTLCAYGMLWRDLDGIIKRPLK